MQTSVDNLNVKLFLLLTTHFSCSFVADLAED